MQGLIGLIINVQALSGHPSVVNAIPIMSPANRRRVAGALFLAFILAHRRPGVVPAEALGSPLQAGEVVAGAPALLDAHVKGIRAPPPPLIHLVFELPRRVVEVAAKVGGAERLGLSQD